MITSPPYARVWFRPPVRMFGYPFPSLIPAIIIYSTEADPSHCRIGLLRGWGERFYVETVVERARLTPRQILTTVDCAELWLDNLPESPFEGVPPITDKITKG